MVSEISPVSEICALHSLDSVGSLTQRTKTWRYLFSYLHFSMDKFNDEISSWYTTEVCPNYW